MELTLALRVAGMGSWTLWLLQLLQQYLVFQIEEGLEGKGVEIRRICMDFTGYDEWTLRKVL